MRLLLLSQSFLPNRGGVETHLALLLPQLKKAGWEITVLTANKNQKNPVEKLKSYEEIDTTVIYRFEIPVQRFFGLLSIYHQLLSKLKLFKQADLIIIHDIFLYFLPLRLLLPSKKVITVFHGWEGQFPIPHKNIFYKQLAQRLSQATISIGQYINHFYQLSGSNSYLSYGAVVKKTVKQQWSAKKPHTLTFVGRLEKDTGIEQCLQLLEELKQAGQSWQVNFCGQGSYAALCQNYGQVLGNINPQPYLAKSRFCFAGGYLSLLEGLQHKNVVLTSFNNPLKKTYWQEHPLRPYFFCADSGKALKKAVFDCLEETDITVKRIEKAADLANSFSDVKLAQLYINLADKLLGRQSKNAK